MTKSGEVNEKSMLVRFSILTPGSTYFVSTTILVLGLAGWLCVAPNKKLAEAICHCVV